MSRAGDILTLAAGLVGPEMGVGACEIGEQADLHPVELMATLPMVPARLAEFAAGRRAARLAMTSAGLSRASVQMGPDRAPVWPDGVIGSIAHAGGVAVAVAASADKGWRGVGLDLELDGPPCAELAETVLTEGEAGLPERLAFSIKEAAYKAQYPVSKQIFGFDVLHLTLDDGSFTAHFAADVPPFVRGDRIDGRYCLGHGFILSIAWLQ